MEDLGFDPEAPTRLWLPGSYAADSAVRRVARAVKAYDEALELARHEVTGDWVVLIGERGHPVFGFGRELPRPEDVERILGARDVKRNGRRIHEATRRKAAQIREANDKAMSDRNGEMAEHFEHGFRRVGSHPRPRIFVPKGIPG